ncbi:pitrilysin family protein [Primorskyibacter aestuariivivens]|uniref:M16 family metallopeptidase n=1 Tax=Primorskyibacter aestuariivivens TaxID=1888912 RepID=UPI0022FFF85E|nr:pitrilysin family protein [Primorskyibacter aestuariivivens]MDA7429412.1 pitrilysin family protein [Primorskyibacter aestuariivivens]
MRKLQSALCAGGFLLATLAPVAHALDVLRDEVTTGMLDNGMQVVVIEDHRAPVAVHMVWYKAGSADEKPGVSGVAHFLEHLLFQGTTNMEPGELSRVVAANGGTDNAFTSYDQTAYFQRVAADRLELMMQMEADRMVNLQLGEEEIRIEREVIIEERNQRTENDPGALMREQMRAAQYLNHRYGVPIIGWRHEMEGLGLEAALDYYQTYYAPNNAVLVVAGDVDPDEVMALAREHYGPLPPNPDLKPRNRPQEPPHTSPRRMVFEDPRVSQPYVIRSYLAPERDPGAQETAAALSLLAEVLGGGQTSVLNEKLQFEQKVSIYAGASYRGVSLDDTTFSLIVVPAPGVSLEEAEEAMDAAVAEFMETGVNADDLNTIKRKLEASRIYARDNVDSLANRYGRALTSGLTIEDIQAWPEILAAVSEEDIMEAARMVFDRNASVTSWLKRAPEVTQ